MRKIGDCVVGMIGKELLFSERLVARYATGAPSLWIEEEITVVKRSLTVIAALAKL